MKRAPGLVNWVGAFRFFNLGYDRETAMMTESRVHLARKPAPSARLSAPVAAWVAAQLAETSQRLTSPYLSDGRRARLERRRLDLQRLLGLRGAR